MALRTPPAWQQQGSYTAENDRLIAQAIVSSTGIIGATSLAVSASSPAAMTVSVASGWGAVLSSVTNGGVYQFYNDAATTLTVTTADPTNPRIDRVVATVNDAYYSGLLNNVTFTVIAGTPAGSPVAPSTPSNSISLATIAVAAAATSIVAGNITDTRTQVSTNLVDTSTVVTLTAAQTLTNKTLQTPREITTVSATAATGTINYDLATQADLYYTTNASANFTLNFRGSSTATLNSILAVGSSVTCVFRNTNGATAYYANALQIDGVALVKGTNLFWQGGSAPSAGNASSIDAYSFVITKKDATPTYTVLASQTKFA